jgi:acetyl esterase/lipase
MKKYRSCIYSLCLLFSTIFATQAQVHFELKTIDNPYTETEIPLYADDAQSANNNQEQWGLLEGTITPEFKIKTRIVRNVNYPTLTPVLPDPSVATGAAVIIAPGGAFLSLSMENEGFNIAQRLAAKGIAAFILKYRLKTTPRENQDFMAEVDKTMASIINEGRKEDYLEPKAPVDALAALKLVQQNATTWHVDKNKIGFIGFSAGATTVLLASIDQGQPRPAFCGFIYGPMTDRKVPNDAPPLFAAFAMDDKLVGHDGFGLVTAWQQAGSPVEVHAYEKGEHGFGVGRPGTTSALMLEQFITWLDSRGLLKPQA